MFFLFPRLEHPAGWICARYKSLLLLLLLCTYVWSDVFIIPNSLHNKGSCWILKDFYCSVTMLRELGLKWCLFITCSHPHHQNDYWALLKSQLHVPITWSKSIICYNYSFYWLSIHFRGHIWNAYTLLKKCPSVILQIKCSFIDSKCTSIYDLHVQCTCGLFHNQGTQVCFTEGQNLSVPFWRILLFCGMSRPGRYQFFFPRYIVKHIAIFDNIVMIFTHECFRAVNNRDVPIYNRHNKLPVLTWETYAIAPFTGTAVAVGKFVCI